MAKKKKKKKKVQKKLYASRIKIIRQGKNSTNNFYASWSFSKSQKKINITKKVCTYVKKTKKYVTKSTKKKYTSVIDNYTVKWYYSVADYKKGKTPKWYLDKTITTSSQNTSSDLYSPPNNAKQIRVSIKVNGKKYKSSKSKTSAWFTTDYVSKRDTDYDEVPEAPTINEFTITNKTLKVEVEVDNIEYDIDRVRIQVLMNGTKYVKFGNDYYKDSTSINSTGLVPFTVNLSTVGSYQVRARVCTVDGGTASANLWSDWSSWSSSIDTRPNPPTNLKASALDDEKIKLTWNKVSNVTQYQIEYVSDSSSYFDSNMVSSTTVDNINSYILSNLEAGHTWYFRVRSVNGSDKSDPSNVISAVLAVKPSPPTTWSSTTTAVIASDVDTTDPTYIYYVHNSQDGSAQRSAQLVFNIGGINYYLTKTNTKTDDYGELIDEITELNLWTLIVYKNEANTISAGTLYRIFVDSFSDSIKWKVRTKGIHASYSDFSIERVIKAYMKPNLSLSVTDKDGLPLIGDILSSFPLILKGETTPSSQTPISYHISIVTSSAYETTDIHGDEIIVSEGSEIYSKFLDINEQLDVMISASDVDFVTDVRYTLKVIVYMDSGLSAEATYDFTPDWVETSDTPELEIEFDETYRYTVLRPYCHYYIGYDPEDDDDQIPSEVDENYEPVAYVGLNITGKVEVGTVFPNSEVAEAFMGDMYFNQSTYETYTCVVGGDPNTAMWLYKTTFDYSDAVKWYSGTIIDGDADEDIYYSSGIELSQINDYYFNVPSGDIYRCVKSGTPSEAVWEYLWNIFWAVTPNTMLSVYRKEQNGSYVAIAEGVNNDLQSTDSALFFRDPHPSFGTCVYRVVSTNTETGGIAFADFIETYGESSVIVQWDEKWSENVYNDDEETFDGNILELPGNIKLSDSNSNDVSLAEYIGRYRPVAYYGTQRGESLKISCEFPKDDTETLTLVRQLMGYQGNVYVREPSGLGYWANVTISYNRNYKELVIPVSIDIKPVEGGV